jgi:uncharacterized damage-inducible protein DinB
VIRHIVLLTFADTATDAQIQAVHDGLSALPARLPQLQAYVIGRDIGINEGNATFAVTADFATVDDYIVYRDDPEHRRVIAEHIAPILVSRAAVQHGTETVAMPSAEATDFPLNDPDERELLLSWLRFLRGVIVRKIEGLSDENARWTPDGALTPLIGIMNHLTHVEWRWVDGALRGEAVNERDDEFRPGPELTVARAVDAYRARAAATEAVVRTMPLDQSGRGRADVDVRWVLLHLINETARHAGHADATRELFDGATGE